MTAVEGQSVPSDNARDQRPFRPDTLVSFDISLGLYLVVWLFFASVISGYLPAQTRAKTSRSSVEMRSLATALESFRVDHGVYPAGSPYAGPIENASSLVTPTNYIGGYSPPPLHGDQRDHQRASSTLLPFLALYFLAGVSVWLLLCRRVGRGLAGLLRPGLFVWLVGLPAFLLSFGAWDLGLAGAVLLGVPTSTSILWFWRESWAWYGKDERFHTGEVLLMGIFPYLLQGKLIAVVATQVLVAHLAAQRPPEPNAYYYATDGHTCFVLQAAGPDGVLNLDLAELIEDGTAELVRFVEGVRASDARVGPYYDPSNGTFSGGDVFRAGP